MADSGTLLGALGALLGCSWGALGRSWGDLGRFLGAISKKLSVRIFFEALLGAKMEPKSIKNLI